MSWKFEPSDFTALSPSQRHASADNANSKLQEWLKNEKVVYGGGSNIWTVGNQFGGDTHKALLIQIEKIEPCRHEASKVYQTTDRDYNETGNFYCECGARVKPSGFEEIK